MSTSFGRQTDQVYVLHTRKYRNTSLIVEALTQDHGRLGFVAKGARQSRSPMYAVLQPFIPLYISWGGSGELHSLYTAEVAGKALQLQQETLYSGMYLNELLMRMLHHHDPHPEIYEAYQQCLRHLSEGDAIDIYLRYFELDLLDSLGYGVNLLHESDTDAVVEAGNTYTYIIEHGPVISHEMDRQALQVSGRTLHQLHRRELNGEVSRQEAKQLLRAVLDYYLGGRPLKSRELLQQLHRLNTSTTENG